MIHGSTPMKQDPPRLARPPTVTWEEDGRTRSASLRCAARGGPPRSLVVVGDELRAADALTLARRNVGLVWRGDYRNARQLLDALKRRLDRRDAKPGLDPAEMFRRHRQARSHRARVLSCLLVELSADYRIIASRAPDVAQACAHAYGPADHAGLVSLQELLGAIGAEQWRVRGVAIPALGARIHPHYGVFAPTRLDYVDLVAQMSLPPARQAFDIGTGTGVLAALLAQRGVPRVCATDIEQRAVDCARDNIVRLGLADRVEVINADLFPDGRADLVVCNPPWLPGTPTSALEAGVYDRNGRMLSTFLRRLPDHLTASGQAWLVLSDLAEVLRLRSRAELTDMISDAGLTADQPISTGRRPTRRYDSLARARADETITVWRLRRA